MPHSNYLANRRQTLVGLLGVGLASGPAAGAGLPASALARQPLPLRVPSARADALDLSSPSAVHLGGWLGQRLDLNTRQRLAVVDTAPLLAGFQHKPGSHPWIGEHVGKWLHAATLAWSYHGDAGLRQELDQVANDLIATQEANGYLGTYEPDKRLGLFDGADWDVWSHKYCLMGLLTYYRFTGQEAALNASRRAADLLLATFPAQRSILAAGTHNGLAATSVLEPMVLLYRLSGDERYLAFARYIVQAWDEPQGPALVKTLLAEQLVFKVNPPKAYEMLSNLVGLAELARVTGNDAWTQACLAAWQDIVQRRRYITGGTSQSEFFQADHDWRDNASSHVSETCVTTTWIQFNMALLQLTGKAQFAQEIERAVYNQLAAAQHTQGQDWCYFTPLHGHKRYLSEINCCHSSGPRGLALAPQVAYLTGRLGADALLLVNTLEPSTAVLQVNGQAVTLELQSDFPQRGSARLLLRMAQPTRFALRVRQPEWATNLRIAGARQDDGWQTLGARTWKDGDAVTIRFPLQAQLQAGNHYNQGRAAMTWGPFVLAVDDKANPQLAPSHTLRWTHAPTLATWDAAHSRLTLATHVRARYLSHGSPAPKEVDAAHSVQLQPYADAGASGGLIRVWLREPGEFARTAQDSLLLDGVASQSRAPKGAPATGALIDDDLESNASTLDGQLATEDWFAVTLPRAVSAKRFSFAAGKASENGGWFDARAGKPRFEIQPSPGAPWQALGELKSYPDTTDVDARNASADWDLPVFSLVLEQPVSFVAVRLVGRPAGGRNPQQPYVSCGELQAFVA